MMKNKTIACVPAILLVGALAGGCGSNKRIESAEVPAQPGLKEQAPAQEAKLEESGRYRVKKNDCLWAIAGKPGIYGDSFDWPLLFKANRDQIQDPDLIYPRQDLKVQKVYSTEEMNRARQTAMATPKYVPHSKPRETLPVDYF